MKYRYVLYLVAGISCCSIAATASLEIVAPYENDIKTLVGGALDRFEQTSLADWSYRLTRYENEEGEITSSIEQFTPNNNFAAQWSLIQINGQVPSEKQVTKFLESKKKAASKDENKGIHLVLKDLIQQDTLFLVDESKDELVIQFDVYLEKLGKKASQKLQGVLTYDKKLQFIRQIEITNLEPFSPVFSASITDFNLQISFKNKGDAILPFQQKLSMQGTFAIFVEIDEESKDTFSQFKFSPTNTE